MADSLCLRLTPAFDFNTRKPYRDLLRWVYGEGAPSGWIWGGVCVCVCALQELMYLRAREHHPKPSQHLSPPCLTPCLTPCPPPCPACCSALV